MDGGGWRFSALLTDLRDLSPPGDEAVPAVRATCRQRDSVSAPGPGDPVAFEFDRNWCHLFASEGGPLPNLRAGLLNALRPAPGAAKGSGPKYRPKGELDDLCYGSYAYIGNA